jgi:hypothetical protein
MVSFTSPIANPIGSGNFNQQAFMQARPDIANAGLDFNTWYNAYGKNEDVNQFQPYIESAGVVPMTIEPMHQFEKQAYTQTSQQQLSPYMAQASGFLSNMLNQPTVNPLATQYMGDAASLTQRGAAPIAFNEVEAMRNPYAAAEKESLNEAGRQARAAMLARQGTRGAASFGNTAMGTEKGYLESELGRNLANVDYRSYNDAYERLLKERGLSLSGGANLGNIGTATQGLTSSGAGIGRGIAGSLYDAGAGQVDAQRTLTADLLAAGQGIRGFNQGMLDYVARDTLGSQNYTPTQIATINSLLDIYGSQTGSQNTAGTSSLERIGGLLTTASPFIEKLGSLEL